MRLQFHVLRYRFDRKRMISVKYQGFCKELIDFLETNGFNHTILVKENEAKII